MVAAGKNYMFKWWLGKHVFYKSLWHYCPTCMELRYADKDSDVLARCDSGHLMVLMEYRDLPVLPFKYEEDFTKAKCSIRQACAAHCARFGNSIFTFLEERRCVHVVVSKG